MTKDIEYGLWRTTDNAIEPILWNLIYRWFITMLPLTDFRSKMITLGQEKSCECSIPTPSKLKQNQIKKKGKDRLEDEATKAWPQRCVYQRQVLSLAQDLKTTLT